MNKVIFPSVIACLVQAASIHAGYGFSSASPTISTTESDADIRDLKQRVGVLEHKYDNEKIGYGAYVFGEWLYWKAAESGLTYAIKNYNNSLVAAPAAGVFTQTILQNGHTYRPHPNNKSGFRLGAGYITPQDGWDLGARWTRYHMHTHDFTGIAEQDPSEVPGFLLFPSWISKLFEENSPLAINTASAHWKMHLDMIDADIQRELYLTKTLAFVPHLGLRTGWIKQSYDLHYFRNLSQFEEDPDFDGLTVHQWFIDMDNNFWGIGIRAGLGTIWSIGQGFSLYGDASFSLLDGHFHTSNEQTAQEYFADFLNANDYFKNKNKLHTDAAVSDLELGLEWSRTFEKCAISLWGGFEQHIFFSQNQFMNYQFDFTLLILPPAGEGPRFYTDGGNLTIEGFTGGFDIAF